MQKASFALGLAQLSQEQESQVHASLLLTEGPTAWLEHEKAELKQYLLRKLAEEARPDFTLQEVELYLKDFKETFRVLESFKSDLACDICSDALAPTDWFLKNDYIRGALDWVATEICVKEGVYGGKKDVCSGGVDTMSKFLLPALADGVLSP